MRRFVYQNLSCFMFNNKSKTWVGLFVFILCCGFVFYFMRKPSTPIPNKSEQELILYQLLPPTTTAFWSLRSISEFEDFYHRIYFDKSPLISTLFNLINNEETLPHILISMSEVSDLTDALFLLPQTRAATRIMKGLLRDCSTAIPPKEFYYREQKLLIYALLDGGFLTYGLINGVYVWSCEKHKVEEVIDAHLDKQALAQTDFNACFTSQKDSLAHAYLCVTTSSYAMGRKACIDSSLCSNQDWLIFKLFRESQGLSAEARLMYETAYSENQELYSSHFFPAETFAYKRWTTNDLDKAYELSLRDTVQTEKESVCNREFYAYLGDILDQGLVNMRVKDTVISSDLLLSLPLSDSKAAHKQLKKLFRTKRRPIRSLLRDEGIYFINDVVIPYPAPLFLNLLADVSRDKRVIYLHYLKDRLLLSWNEDLLNRYLEQLTEKKTANNYLEAYHLQDEQAYLSFVADLGEVANDIRRPYTDLATFLLQSIDQFTDYFLSKTYSKHEGYTLVKVKLLKR